MLPGYTFFDPPHDRSVTSLTPHEARAYFVWFIKNIPNRLTELACAVRHNNGDAIELDYSRDSLLGLGSWFGRHISTMKLTVGRVAELRATVPSWAAYLVADWDLSNETASLCADVGIYLGRTLQRYHPELAWDYVRKPRRAADIHQPVLIGFRHRMYLNPVRIMSVIAYKAIDGIPAGEELTEAFDVWNALA